MLDDLDQIPLLLHFLISRLGMRKVTPCLPPPQEVVMRIKQGGLLGKYLESCETLDNLRASMRASVNGFAYGGQLTGDCWESLAV